MFSQSMVSGPPGATGPTAVSPVIMAAPPEPELAPTRHLSTMERTVQAMIWHWRPRIAIRMLCAEVSFSILMG